MRLMQYKESQLTFNRIYEFKPERFYSLIFRMERRFFPELKKQISKFERTNDGLQIWQTTLTDSEKYRSMQSVLHLGQDDVTNPSYTAGMQKKKKKSYKGYLLLGIKYKKDFHGEHLAWRRFPLNRKWKFHFSQIEKYIDQYSIPRQKME